MDTPRLEHRDLELPRIAILPPARHRARRFVWIGLGVVVVAGAYEWWQGNLLSGLGAARTWIAARLGIGGAAGQGPRAVDVSQLLVHTVAPVDLRITALENGTLESAGSAVVLSEVEGQVAIIRLVPEGTRVAKGDVVVELESSALRTRLTEQQIAVARAEAAHSQALQASKMADSQAESDVANSELALEFAKLDLEKYEKGEYPVQLRSLQTDTALAQEELKRAQTQLQFSEELQRDGYIGSGELEADRFRVTQCQYRVDIARERERLLQEYTWPRTKRDLDSKVAEATRALGRTKSIAAGSREQAGSALKAQQATLELERTKLRRNEDQIGKCSMRAPQAGVVVYPVPEDQDRVELFIREGTIVRERQHVFSIPDTDVLQVTTSIHEAVVDQIKAGMPVRIWIDVYHGLELRGAVLSVSPLPEPGDWRRTTVKFYETKVRIDTPATGLRPGMSAKVEILIESLPQVLAVPVQSVVQRGHDGVCYVLDGSPQLRKLRLGKSNAEYVAVLDGLAAGEQIVLSPDVLGIPPDALPPVPDGVPPPQDAGIAAANADAERGAATAAPASSSQETKYVSVLEGPAGVTVAADYKVKTKGTTTNLRFQIKVAGGKPATTWEVAVAGTVIGTVTLDDAGACEVEWATKAGTFPANFPATIGVGTEVRVGPDYHGQLTTVN